MFVSFFVVLFYVFQEFRSLEYILAFFLIIVCLVLQRLYQKVYDAQRIAYEKEVASSRKSLVGSGDRSDKIRTYNYPQNRVTDHRLTGDSKNFSLQTIIAGDIGGIIEELQLFENTEKLKAIEAE